MIGNSKYYTSDSANHIHCNIDTRVVDVDHSLDFFQ